MNLNFPPNYHDPMTPGKQTLRSESLQLMDRVESILRIDNIDSRLRMERTEFCHEYRLKIKKYAKKMVSIAMKLPMKRNG